MNKLTKLRNDEFFQAFVGDRGLRVYKHPVDGRLGMTGLSKLIKRVTGHDPKQDEAYCFSVKNRDVVKILTKDYWSINIMEFYDGSAKEMKELFVELEKKWKRSENLH